MRLTRLLTGEEIKLANDYSTNSEKKRKQGDFTICNNVSPFELENKLGQLEDIEDDIGIDLITFLKMFTQENIYIKCNGEIFENDVEFAINCDKKGYFINLEICQFDRLYLKDYGKTWALTKEELL